MVNIVAHLLWDGLTAIQIWLNYGEVFVLGLLIVWLCMVANISLIYSSLIKWVFIG